MLLLHRQGQHLVPHADLAGAAHGLRGDGRATQPALRRAGERVPEHRGQQDLDEPAAGGLGARLPRRVTIRTRCATTSRRSCRRRPTRDFTWADFVRRNNDELVATWGNLVNRVLTFTYKNFDGRGARRRGS